MNITAAIIRYGFPGVLLGILVFFSFPNWINGLKQESNIELISVVLTVIVIFVGVILHHIYYLIYAIFFTRIQDVFRIKSDSYRTYLMRLYSLNKRDAVVLFRYLRDNYFRKIYTETLEIAASTIHLFYFSTLLFCIFFIMGFFIELGIGIYWYLLFAVINFVVGFLLDRNYEWYELACIKGLDKKDIITTIEKLFKTDKTYLDAGQQKSNEVK